MLRWVLGFVLGLGLVGCDFHQPGQCHLVIERMEDDPETGEMRSRMLLDCPDEMS